MIEKPIASGISASATTIPARMSARMFESQSRLIALVLSMVCPWVWAAAKTRGKNERPLWPMLHCNTTRCAADARPLQPRCMPFADNRLTLADRCGPTVALARLAATVRAHEPMGKGFSNHVSYHPCRRRRRHRARHRCNGTGAGAGSNAVRAGNRLHRMDARQRSARHRAAGRQHRAGHHLALVRSRIEA